MTLPAILLAFLSASPAFAAAPARQPLDRSIGGARLGMSMESAQKDLGAVETPKELAAFSRPGETLRLLPKVKHPLGGGEFIGEFNSGKLRRLQWTWAGKDAEKQAWASLLQGNEKRYGPPAIRHEKVEGVTRDIAEWSDGKTRLTLTRDPKPKDTHYYGAVEDVSAAFKAPGPTAALPASATPYAPTEIPCSDFSDCYNSADRNAKAGRCDEAIYLFGRAIALRADPWPLYHRAVLKRARGDEAGASADFALALKNKALASDFKRTSLPTAKEIYGPKWSCP